MKAIGRATVLFAALASAAGLLSASAAVSITVQPLVAEFGIAPGASGTIPVTVTNSGSEPARFSARRTDWRTTASGSIALEKVGTEGTHSLSRDLSLSQYQFTLQPGEHRQLQLTLHVPASALTAPHSSWGGFFINSTPVNAPSGAVGLAATVFVYNTIGTPHRHITMQSLRVSRGPGGTATLVARLRNDATAYCRPSAHLMIEQAGRIVDNRTINISTIFPNTTRLLSEPLGHLAPGPYRIELAIDYGGDSVIEGVTEAHI